MSHYSTIRIIPCPAAICPIRNRSKTDKPSTIGGRIKTDTSPNSPRQNPHHTDIKPTDNRQFVGKRSCKHVWNISPRQICLPEHKPTPNRQNRINTDWKPISPRIWCFLSVWGRFRVGLGGVTGVLMFNVAYSSGHFPNDKGYSLIISIYTSLLIYKMQRKIVSTELLAGSFYETHFSPKYAQ